MELRLPKEFPRLPVAKSLFEEQPLTTGDKVWLQDFYKDEEKTQVFKGGLFYVQHLFPPGKKPKPEEISKYFKVDKASPRFKRLCRPAGALRIVMQKIDNSKRCVIVPMSYFERGIAGRIGHAQT